MDPCGQCGLPMKEGQNRCLKCGTPVVKPEGRTVSGTRHTFGSICGSCGALLPESSARCLICSAEQDGIPFEGTFPVPPERGIPAPESHPRRRASRPPDTLRRLGGILSALICVMAVVLTSYGVWLRYFDTSGYRAADALVYETLAGRVMLFHPGLEAPLEVAGMSAEGTSFTEGRMLAEPNGRRLASVTSDGRLYVLDLGRPAPEGDGFVSAALIAGRVTESFFFSRDGGHLVYLTENGKLFATDYTESWQLDDGVAELIAVENNQALYTRREETGGRARADLYLYEILRDSGDWTLIDRDIVQALDWTDGFDRVLYTANRTDASGREGAALLSFDRKVNSSALLAEGVDFVADASAGSNTALYLTRRTSIWTYQQFVDDDLADADALIFKPFLEDYPQLAEAYALYGEDAVLDHLEDTEELLEQNAAYQEAMRLWEDKQQRDETRRRLHSRIARQSEPLELYDLMLCRNREVTVLDTGVRAEAAISAETGSASLDKGYALYERVDMTSLRRLKMSEIWETPSLAEINLNSYFLENTRRELACSPLNGPPALLYAGTSGLTQRLWKSSPHSDGVYFTVGPPGLSREQDDLYYAAWTGGGVKAASGIAALYGSCQGGMLCADADGAVYLAQGGSIRRLGGASSRLGSLENGGASLLLYTEYSKESGSGTLCLFGREEVMLADTVTAYDYRADQLIYLQRGGERQGVSALYVWHGGRLSLLAEGIRSAFSTGQDA